jgi:diazepam-binding inhibitor (GABA receptor modulating acyl-CoA-binding protein)
VSSLETRFEIAAQQATQLPSRPDNDTLWRLYALYKQATQGDVSGKRPGFANPVGRAKYDAWARSKGISKDEAMESYIDLVKSLKG